MASGRAGSGTNFRRSAIRGSPRRPSASLSHPLPRVYVLLPPPRVTRAHPTSRFPFPTDPRLPPSLVSTPRRRRVAVAARRPSRRLNPVLALAGTSDLRVRGGKIHPRSRLESQFTRQSRLEHHRDVPRRASISPSKPRRVVAALTSAAARRRLLARRPSTRRESSRAPNAPAPTRAPPRARPAPPPIGFEPGAQRRSAKLREPRTRAVEQTTETRPRDPLRGASSTAPWKRYLQRAGFKLGPSPSAPGAWAGRTTSRSSSFARGWGQRPGDPWDRGLVAGDRRPRGLHGGRRPTRSPPRGRIGIFVGVVVDAVQRRRNPDRREHGFIRADVDWNAAAWASAPRLARTRRRGTAKTSGDDARRRRARAREAEAPPTPARGRGEIRSAAARLEPRAAAARPPRRGLGGGAWGSPRGRSRGRRRRAASRRSCRAPPRETAAAAAALPSGRGGGEASPPRRATRRTPTCADGTGGLSATMSSSRVVAASGPSSRGTRRGDARCRRHRWGAWGGSAPSLSSSDAHGTAPERPRRKGCPPSNAAPSAEWLPRPPDAPSAPDPTGSPSRAGPAGAAYRAGDPSRSTSTYATRGWSSSSMSSYSSIASGGRAPCPTPRRLNATHPRGIQTTTLTRSRTAVPGVPFFHEDAPRDCPVRTGGRRRRDIRLSDVKRCVHNPRVVRDGASSRASGSRSLSAPSFPPSRVTAARRATGHARRGSR